MNLATKPSKRVTVSATQAYSGRSPLQVLGIKSSRKRGRAHEVAEHHRQLPPLGFENRGASRRFPSPGRGGVWHALGMRRLRLQRSNCFEQAAAVTDQSYSQVLEVLGVRRASTSASIAFSRSAALVPAIGPAGAGSSPISIPHATPSPNSGSINLRGRRVKNLQPAGPVLKQFSGGGRKVQLALLSVSRAIAAAPVFWTAG